MADANGKPPTKVAESIGRLDDLTSEPAPRTRKGRVKTSRYRGVSLSSTSKLKPWLAQIVPEKNHPQVRIGFFAIEEDAARAWDRAAIACGRPREQLNFPDEATIDGPFLAAADIEAETSITVGANMVGPGPTSRSAMASEVAAMTAIMVALDGLDAAACRRVLEYVMGHFGDGESQQ